MDYNTAEYIVKPGIELEKLKNNAALMAVDFVRSGMVVGLGTGSTAEYAISEIARRVNEHKLEGLVFVPTSLRTFRIASELGLNMSYIEEHVNIDLTIDGADEVDPDMNLIKGGGGALLREKLIAQCSERNIIIVDESKVSGKLGTNFSLPVEVFPFAVKASVGFIGGIGGNAKIRLNDDSSYFTTDQGNYIIDCDFGPIHDLRKLSNILGSRAGIAEHGLFLGIATDLIVGKAEGTEHIQKEK